MIRPESYRESNRREKNMAENISRRSFLKGVTAGAIGLGTMGLASASAESVKAMYKAGTYTSVQKT